MKKKNTSQALNLYRGKMQLPPAAPQYGRQDAGEARLPSSFRYLF